MIAMQWRPKYEKSEPAKQRDFKKQKKHKHEKKWKRSKQP